MRSPALAHTDISVLYVRTLGTTGEPGEGNHQFECPTGVCVEPGPDGRVYVADTYNHRIRHLGLTDVEDPLIKYEPTWEETASTVLEHNLQLILVTIGGSIGGSARVCSKLCSCLIGTD